MTFDAVYVVRHYGAALLGGSFFHDGSSSLRNPHCAIVGINVWRGE